MVTCCTFSKQVSSLTQRQGSVLESIAQSVAGIPAHLHGSVSSGCVYKSPHGLIKRLSERWLTQMHRLQEVQEVPQRSHCVTLYLQNIKNTITTTTNTQS